MSEILFLGTGAADWNIANKTDDFRRFSSALVNGELLLDCTDHIFDFAKDFDFYGFASVTDIIITHNHDDHFCRETVLKLAENRKIRVGCSKEIKEIIGENENIEFVVFSPFKETTVGKYRVIPILANHDIVADGDAYAFHHIIYTPDNKCIFYGLDGAWFLRPSWQEMKKHKFDVMVFDCTVGDRDDWRIFEHNTIPMIRFMVKEIENVKILSPNAKMIASHIARTLHVSHEDTERTLKEIDVMTAFDGMKVEF